LLLFFQKLIERVMFKPQNKIIIVDDREDELNTLSKSFLGNGIGCRPFLYDTVYDEPLKNVRIAFFDINLTEKRINTEGKTPEEIIRLNSPIFSDLAVAINQYVHKENGPYALFFWTKNKLVVDGFINYMQDGDRGYSDTASPIFVGYIDKDEISAKGEEFLSTKLLEVLNNDKIRFYFEFESNASIAGEKTINNIHKIVPKEDKWGESEVLFENLSKVLSKIAASTLGFEHSKEQPSKAVYEGLLPLLNNEIINCESAIDWEQLLKPLYEAEKYSKLVSPSIELQRKINGIFHIENPNENKSERGAVIEIDISTDSLKSFNIDNLEVWIQSLLSIKDGEARNELRERLLKNSKLIAIEISAACDHSNKKKRINKYILGLITEPIKENDINIKGRIESSYHLGGCDFSFGTNEFQIWLNLNFVFGAIPEDNRLNNSLFILKKEIMDMLGNKYASHISRIGITSF